MLTLVPCYEYVVLEKENMIVYYTGSLSKATEMSRLLAEGTSQDPEVVLQCVESGVQTKKKAVVRLPFFR